MNNNTIPIARIFSDAAAEFQGPYRPGWIEAFKREIPHGIRTYDPDTRIWTIEGDAYWIELATRIFLDEFPHARVERKVDVDIVAPADAYRTLYLLPGAPAPLVQAAYRCLAKISHPDHGGSHERMLAINASYERLQEAGVA